MLSTILKHPRKPLNLFFIIILTILKELHSTVLHYTHQILSLEHVHVYMVQLFSILRKKKSSELILINSTRKKIYFFFQIYFLDALLLSVHVISQRSKFTRPTSNKYRSQRHFFSISCKIHPSPRRVFHSPFARVPAFFQARRCPALNSALLSLGLRVLSERRTSRLRKL